MPEVDLKRVRRTAVSPELALVDAELARVERARLDERAKLDAYKEAPRRFTHSREDIERLRRAVASAEDDEQARRRGGNAARSANRARPIILLGAAAVVAGGVAAGLKYGGGNRPVASSPTPTRSVAASRTTAATTRRVQSDARDAAVEAGRLPPARMLEAHVLTLLGDAPPSKLPPQLVDPQTHTLRKYLRATCRSTGTRAFLCIVRAPQRPRGEGLYVRYRGGSGGGGTFAWIGYRRS